MPHDFPPAFTVHSFYRRAKLTGLWDKILQHMVKVTRKNAGLEEKPTVALVDSQSVQNASASEQSGYDAGKKRKELSDRLSPTKQVVYWLLSLTRQINTIQKSVFG